MCKLHIVLFLTAAILNAASASKHNCAPEYIAKVQDATNLQRLLVITQDVPEAAAKSLIETQDNEREVVLQSVTALEDRYSKFRRQYEKKPSCACTYKKAVNKFKKSEAKLQEIVDVDHVVDMQKKFDGKFEKNVEFIQKTIKSCKGSPCKDEDKKVKDVQKRLLDVHDDWCGYVDSLLDKDEKNAAEIEKKAMKDISKAEEKLEKLKCAKEPKSD